jgi:uncharacterized protein (DUF983 family)
MFWKFLKVVDRCDARGEELHHHRADDFPAYIVISVVGHIVVPAALYVETHFAPSALWLPTTLGLTLGLLQPTKGFIVAAQLNLGMHGFEHARKFRNTADSLVDEPTPSSLTIVSLANLRRRGSWAATRRRTRPQAARNLWRDHSRGDNNQEPKWLHSVKGECRDSEVFLEEWHAECRFGSFRVSAVWRLSVRSTVGPKRSGISSPGLGCKRVYPARRPDIFRRSCNPPRRDVKRLGGGMHSVPE